MGGHIEEKIVWKNFHTDGNPSPTKLGNKTGKQNWETKLGNKTGKQNWETKLGNKTGKQQKQPWD